MKPLNVWLLLGGLAAWAGSACAEDISISTYYPSPRGVYQELRTTNNTYLATLAGSVGIGTISPAAKLDIVGNPSIRMTDGATRAKIDYAANNLYIASNDARTDLFISSAGNVGIGTTAPGATLNVVPLTSGIADALRVGRNGGTSATQYIGFSYSNGAGNIISNDGLNTFAAGAAPIIFSASDSTPASTRENMRITGSGNVGIGTTSPATKLDVNGEIRTDGYNYQIQTQSGWGGWARAYKFINPSGADLVDFGAYGSGTSYAYAYIGPTYSAPTAVFTNAGNVGIGTTSPVTPLSILGTAGSGNLEMGNVSGGTYIQSYDRATSAYKKLFLYTQANPTITLDTDGNVGIGMSPGASYRLDVSGDIHATNTIKADSDARFKQDLQPLSGILPKLASLHSISYTPSALGHARGMSAGRQLGVLGQELEQVFPELVSASGPEQYRSVDYSRLTVVLLEALKELKQQDAEAINALKARLDALEKTQQRR